MKKAVQSILKGYIHFFKTSTSFLLVLLFFLALAVAAGYPMWFLATKEPAVYTAFALSFLALLLLSSLGMRLKGITDRDGTAGLFTAIREFFVNTGKYLLAIVTGLCTVYLFGHGMIAFGIAGAATFLTLTGFLFFKN
ncbi:MAG: hypothetical protein JXB03_00765 [Spirochaetales bacterium]|nr:hypothetical protein [Spirochaetales bacterium]